MAGTVFVVLGTVVFVFSFSYAKLEALNSLGWWFEHYPEMGLVDSYLRLLEKCINATWIRHAMLAGVTLVLFGAVIFRMGFWT